MENYTPFGLYLEQGKEQKAITKFLKTLTVSSMSFGKDVLEAMLSHPTPTLNDLLTALGYSPVTNGDQWGWPNLLRDLLSNKYGVCARPIYKSGKHISTYFTLHLPTPVHVEEASL